MSELNDKGERHRYWELFYVNKNYHNGILHGKYEYYYDKEKTRIYNMGVYNMGRRTGLWVQYNHSNQLKLKVFYL